eukprot:6213412-Pleurochrysis_carterae.AAC.7
MHRLLPPLRQDACVPRTHTSACKSTAQGHAPCCGRSAERLLHSVTAGPSRKTSSLSAPRAFVLFSSAATPSLSGAVPTARGQTRNADDVSDTTIRRTKTSRVPSNVCPRSCLLGTRLWSTPPLSLPSTASTSTLYLPTTSAPAPRLSL